MNRAFFCTFGAATMLLSVSAGAQEFGTQGQFAISAERLFGYVHSSSTASANGVDFTTKVDTFSLLSSDSATSYSSPRVGGDYFVIDHLSLGAALGYAHVTISQPNTPDGTVGVFTLAPRVGYAFNFSDVVGLWPRAGFTYSATSAGARTASDTTSGGHQLALTLEAPLVITPVPHVAFTVGPTFDIGLDGSTDVTVGNVTQSTSTTVTAIGLQAGLTVYL